MSFGSYTMRLSVSFEVLFQMLDGIEPLNELLAIDLPWGIIYKINSFMTIKINRVIYNSFKLQNHDSQLLKTRKTRKAFRNWPNKIVFG